MIRALLCAAGLLAACGPNPVCHDFVAAQRDCAAALGEPAATEQEEGEVFDACEEALGKIGAGHDWAVREYFYCLMTMDCADEASAQSGYLACLDFIDDTYLTDE